MPPVRREVDGEVGDGRIETAEECVEVGEEFRLDDEEFEFRERGEGGECVGERRGGEGCGEGYGSEVGDMGEGGEEGLREHCLKSLEDEAEGGRGG